MISSPKQQRQARANLQHIPHYGSDSDDSGDDDFVPDGFKKKRAKDTAATSVSHMNSYEQPNLTRSYSRRDTDSKRLGRDSNE